MKKIFAFSALTAMLLAANLANAAGTTELKVTGVIKPPACTPSFTAGGTVDYGTITANSLSATAPTVLDEKIVPFSVTCEATTRVAVKATDNRGASTVAGLIAKVKTNAGSYTDDNLAYGLGSVRGKKTGIYLLRTIQGSFTADGTTPDVIRPNDSTLKNWAKSVSGLFYSGGDLKAFAPSGTLTPGAYKTLSGNFGIQAVIDRTSNLDLTGDITLDGSATIEVVYL